MIFSYRLFVACFLSALFLACNSGNGKNNPTETHAEKPEKPFELVLPQPDKVVGFEDSVFFRLEASKKIKTDSVVLYLDGKKLETIPSDTLQFGLSKLFSKVGRQTIRLKVFYSEGSSQSLSVRLIVLSDIQPEQLQYKVLRKLPHNANDFTQGFFYYKGHLYEGTGRPAHSRLIKTNPDDGTVVLERKLDQKLFGEGITRVGDKIYQLTYRHKIGFVYDLETFSLLREFDLQTMEGWGLTYNGESIIMSDGSSYLYYYDPEYFSPIKQLDVANNQGLVNSLNELEYVEGYIWANLYTTNVIVKIDAETGKVVATLNLEALFPEEIPTDYDHVLNGIAYNPDKDSYFITGKLWPVIYELKIYD